ncbi:hypothetical protein EYF80_061434 [Liparis tanakae]|uniref:Uncharacterized protein n=1 Tax=Liparis tanakae TaxID=230148 RepID=A0A4Z2EI52_9TELE|nr:hypothetical protein EYF80_061434 [Liparis tanakae]
MGEREGAGLSWACGASPWRSAFLSPRGRWARSTLLAAPPRRCRRPDAPTSEAPPPGSGR